MVCVYVYRYECVGGDVCVFVCVCGGEGGGSLVVEWYSL